MSTDVLALDVRDECFVGVWLSFEDFGDFSVMFVPPEMSGRKKQAKLKGHIEPRQSRSPIQLSSGEIVNPQTAF